MVSVTPLSRQIWDMKYRLKSADGTPVDATIEASWDRVAQALAAPEKPDERGYWAAKFRDILDDFKFLPAGRILAGTGSGREVTLFNCFVMGEIPDDMSGIFEHLREAALTMQQGGGIGYDFSTLRPKGAPVKGVGADASGPLSFMDVWDAMCRTIMSAGSRRGAMMATMRCDHPDIRAFIEAKRDPGRLRMFNLSVLVTDAFMEAVKQNGPWDLTFDGTVYDTVPARDIWDLIMRATFEYAEPGVIFIDRINRANNLHYAESITATNPCGEQPLPPYGACLLGSVNLARLVKDPFTEQAAIDPDELEELVRVAVRMMDNVVDVSKFPLEAQAHEARAKRRIGLGVTGLADAMIMCRARYGAADGIALAEQWMTAIERAAYLASTELAREKGSFPLFDSDLYLAGETVSHLDQDVREAIAKNGIRNALLTSIAPTGTISLFADNVSSGLEPVFSFSYTRKVLMPDGSRREERVSDYAHQLYCRMFGEDAPLPDYFVTSLTLTPNDHVAMQAVVQKHIDSSISKTINCPSEISFDDFKDIYLTAYDSGCKGCTTYRPNEITGSVLDAGDSAKKEPEEQAQLPLEEPQPRPKDVFDAGSVVYMTQPLDRPGVLEGNTYKVRWPESDHAIYITVNDVLQDGRLRPFEVFINSKNMEHYAWTVALTRMISAVFRRGGDISFVVEELKAVFDPRGGYWMNGRYVPSLLAAIGEVIEQHLVKIGFIPGADQDEVPVPEKRAQAVGESGSEQTEQRLPSCPRCGAPSLVRQAGCDTCMSCGHSKCG
jgi:ribonucleoside-diphosphate reductase alpha chain